MLRRSKYLFAAVLALVLAVNAGPFASATVEASDLSGRAPVAENLELSTYRGVSIGGKLAASDPDGGAVRFEITTRPVKGSVDLDADGHFVYTPAEGKRGKDYFGYRAVDDTGNSSQEATVIIKIQKQSSKLKYADTAGLGSAYAAVRLAEEDIYTGAMVAGEYVFGPDTPVTRQEFLTMCMKLSGKPVLSGVRTTGFADDAAVETWAKPYVSSALRYGIISGHSQGDVGVVFEPDRAISVLEAAVILDRAVGLTDAVTTWFGYDDAVPAWALQSASNVSSCGLLPYGCTYSDASLSRGAAAEMLCGAMTVLSRR